MNSFWLSSVGGAFSKRRHAAVLRRQRRSRDLQRGEQLEERRVMAFDFVSAFPNAGQFITPNSTLDEAPQQITLRFSPGAKIDANTLGAISIVRSGSGSDPVFGNGNDVPVTPAGGVGIVAVDDFPEPEPGRAAVRGDAAGRRLSDHDWRRAEDRGGWQDRAVRVVPQRRVPYPGLPA
jgi:hypothetical protein